MSPTKQAAMLSVYMDANLIDYIYFKTISAKLHFKYNKAFWA